MLKSPLVDRSQRDQVEAEAERLSQPATHNWLMARVAALLTPYYTGDVPHSVRLMEAEDWAASLQDFPEWAVQKACRWWKGDENPNRRKKPLEGDIATRCRWEMGIVRVAETAVAMFDDGRKPYVPQEPHKPATAEEKARVSKLIQEAGFAPRRFPKVGEGAQ